MPSCGVVARIVAGVFAAILAVYIGPDGMDLAVFDPWREGGFMDFSPPYWRDHRVKATPGIHIAFPPNDTAPPIPVATQRFAALGVEETAALDLATESSTAAAEPRAAESWSWNIPSSSAASIASVVLRTLGQIALRCLYIVAGLAVISNRFLTRHHAIPPPPPPSPKLQAAICTVLPPSPPPSPSLSANASSSMKAPPPPLRSASPTRAAPSQLSFSAIHVNVDMAPTTPPTAASTPVPAPPPASTPTPTPTPTAATGSPASDTGPRPASIPRPASGPRYNPGANNFVPNAGQRPVVPPFPGRGGHPFPVPNFMPGFGGRGGPPQYNPGYGGYGGAPPYGFAGFGGPGGPTTFIPGFGGRGGNPPAPGATQADWDAYLARFPNHGQQQPRFI